MGSPFVASWSDQERRVDAQRAVWASEKAEIRCVVLRVRSGMWRMERRMAVRREKSDGWTRWELSWRMTVRERKPWAMILVRISRAVWMTESGVDDHLAAWVWEEARSLGDDESGEV